MSEVSSVWVKLDGTVKEIAVSREENIKKLISKSVGQSKPRECAKMLKARKTFKRTELLVDLPLTTKENPIEIFEGKNIFQHGLPPAALYGGTTFSSSTKSSKSSTHKPAQFDEKRFAILDTAREKKSSTFESMVWIAHNRHAVYGFGSLSWGSEADLCRIVIDVLWDVAIETGMEQLNCIQQLSLFQAYKQDIWIVCAFGIPIGLVEVKSSLASNPPLENPLCFGQIYDYLIYLKECLGIQYAFGILTTYDEWRIVWLPDSDDYASAAQLPCHSDQLLSPSPSRVQGPQCNLMDLDPPNWNKNSKLRIHMDSDITEAVAHLSLEPTGSDHEADSRVLHGTSIISWNDPELSFMLVSVLQKMNASPKIPLKISLQPNRSYIFVTNDKWQWKKPRKQSSLCVKSTIPSNVDNAFLLADLGGSGDGRVWLGSTACGEVFVAKFSENKSSLEQESQLWESIWNCSTRVTQLNNYSVLLMPWVKPCSSKQTLTDEVKLLAKQAIKKFAIAGYCHDDLKWSHVGLYKRGDKLQALLFDLARVTKTESQLAEKDMLRSLRIKQ